MKKRNKKKRLQILVLALGFVCCALFLIWWMAPSVSYENQYAASVASTLDIPLYEKHGEDYQETATLHSGVAVGLADKNQQDMSSGYFQLKDHALYMKAEALKPTAVEEQETNTLYLAFPQAVKTKASYTLYDQEDKPLITMHKQQEYPLYFRSNKKIGIKIESVLYYLHPTDVDTFVDANTTKAKAAKQIPVFIYHYFYDQEQGERAENGNWLEIHDFEEQLQYLKEQKYHTITMQDLEYFLDGYVQLPTHCVSITIDDGSKSVYRYAYPLLKKYEMQATLFLITNKFENDQLPSAFQEMRKGGMELQSHSYAMHTGGCDGGHGGALRCIDHDAGVADTKKSFAILQGGNVYCYPYGDVTNSALAIMKDSDVHMAFTTEYGKIEAGMDKLQLPRVRIFGEAGLSQFIYSLEE